MRFTSTHDVDDVRLIMLIMLVRMIVDDDDGASSAVITKTLQSSMLFGKASALSTDVTVIKKRRRVAVAGNYKTSRPQMTAEKPPATPSCSKPLSMLQKEKLVKKWARHLGVVWYRTKSHCAIR